MRIFCYEIFRLRRRSIQDPPAVTDGEVVRHPLFAWGKIVRSSRVIQYITGVPWHAIDRTMPLSTRTNQEIYAN